MRMSAIAAILMMFVGAALLLHPSTPVAAQQPQALTPSPEPPPPGATQAPTTTPTPLVTPTQAPAPPPYPAPGTPTPRPTRVPEPNPGTADVAISKRGGSTQARPGELISFTITVANLGDGPANDVVVTDELPDVLSVYSATTTRGVISSTSRTVTVSIGRLEPGDEVSITVVALVGNAVQTSGYTNRASVVTSSPELSSGNNTGLASFDVLLQPTAVPPTAMPATPLPATPPPGDPCQVNAAGGTVPTCTPLPGTPHPPTAVPPHPTAVPVPKALPATGATFVDALGLLLLATGALVLGLVLRRRTPESEN